MGKTVKRAAELLPDLVRVARANFRGDNEVRTAVLLAWTGLAGITGWTPSMVRAVEQEMRRGA